MVFGGAKARGRRVDDPVQQGNSPDLYRRKQFLDAGGVSIDHDGAAVALHVGYATSAVSAYRG
jgi:hypothetical protein